MSQIWLIGLLGLLWIGVTLGLLNYSAHMLVSQVLQQKLELGVDDSEKGFTSQIKENESVLNRIEEGLVILDSKTHQVIFFNT